MKHYDTFTPPLGLLSLPFPCSRCYFNHIEAWFKRNNKTNEEANFNSFHFSFDSTSRYIWGLFLFPVCVSACILNTTDCLETLKASWRHIIDMLEMKCNLSSTITLWVFPNRITQQLRLSLQFCMAPGCRLVDIIMKYWDTAGGEKK